MDGSVTELAEHSPDGEAQAKIDSDLPSIHNDEHVEYEIETYQGDLQSIQPETTFDGQSNACYSIDITLMIVLGQMGENKMLHFELEQKGARLLYQPALPNDPKREINIQLSGQTAQLTTDPPYERTKAQRVLAKTIATDVNRASLPENATDSSPTTVDVGKTTNSATNVPSVRASQRPANKSLKQTDDYYISSLTKSLNNLFTQSTYDRTKLRKLHDELIASGHISPLNEFYRSTNEAVRITLEHCDTFDQLIKWTLSLLQTTNKPNLTDFGRNLYGIAIDLDFALNDRIDNTRCAMEIQEYLKRQLLTISDHALRGKSRDV